LQRHRAALTFWILWRSRLTARASKAAIETRKANMQQAMQSAELTIKRGLSNEEIHDLARSSHGGNYQGNPGCFYWSNRAARNAIRHRLTNYESLWEKINRGGTGAGAYVILKGRVETLVDEAYPHFAPGMPEVEIAVVDPGRRKFSHSEIG
jgi:hypothetical protein